MQKLRCPRCGVINLEKFVTYPQCAGCGSTLPQPVELRVAFWRRRMSSWMWMALVGGALTGLLIAVSLLQAPVETNEAVILYGHAARRGAVGDTVVLTLTADAIPSRRNETLRDVRLRLPLEIFQTLRLISISPQPDEMTISGSSRYFSYRFLPRETNISLRLRAVAPGSQRFRATLYAAEHLPADWNIKIVLQPSVRQLTAH